MTFAHLKPAVPKCWLFAASGLMWSAVGIMMCATGFGWLMREGLLAALGLAVAGLGVAIMSACRLFGGMAKKNIQRLRRLPQRGCLFAFQAWKSYLIIALMVALGVALRYASVPAKILSVIYTGIGGALLLSSFHYYRHIVRLLCTVHRRAAKRRAV
jgi:hypothetical protein